jgi:hypothetical protein
MNLGGFRGAGRPLYGRRDARRYETTPLFLTRQSPPTAPSL